MRELLLILLTPIMLMAQACREDPADQPSSPTSSNPTTIDNTWLVPINEILDGGPGKDGIPSIDNPQFTRADQVDFLENDDLVLLMRVGDVTKAYPHPILDWHEIVNDDIEGKKIAITYCPLTGTGIGWNREIDGKETTFGVSGLLYNSNLMPYDRLTNSTWSQQRLDCVNGQLRGTNAEVYTLVETNFATLKRYFPQSQVLNGSTGFDRSYGRYPYGDYKSNQSRLLFPVSNKDNRLGLKERVLGVILSSGEKKVYGFDAKAGDPFLIEDQLGGIKLTVIGSQSQNFLVAFETVDFQLALDVDDSPFIVKDQNGIRYDLLGNPAPGAVANALKLPSQFIGYWFSWGTFYPNIDLYGN